MEAIQAIIGRRVSRNFSTRPIEIGKLKTIVDAGRHAMSARNLQPWAFVIIRDRQCLKEIGALCSTGKFVADAPAAVVLLKDLGNKRWADIDCAQAVQNMANAAWALELGTCWVGNLDKEKIATMLGVAEPWEVFTVLPFGYLDSSNPPQARPLKPAAANVFYERFGDHRP